MKDQVTGQERVFHTRIDSSGRIVVPAEAALRRRAKEGDTIVVIEDDNGELRLQTLDDVVRRVQDYFCKLIPPEVSLVDELVAERRAEAARE